MQLLHLWSRRCHQQSLTEAKPHAGLLCTCDFMQALQGSCGNWKHETVAEASM
jgi:hypothetical protein